VLPGRSPSMAYAMWAVAFRGADSTRYRYFVAATRLPPPGASGDDTTAAAADVIPLCTAVARAAALPGVQPRQPTGEETLNVWRRRQ
jgi:hypothetical protein